MIDFYNELKKYEKLPEPKELKNLINKERMDFVDIATKMLLNDDYKKTNGDY